MDRLQAAVASRVLVDGFKSVLHSRSHLARWMVCGALGAIFAWNVSMFYFPGQGLSYFIQFGALEHDRYLPELKAADHHEVPDSHGYDSQWYAEIAMHPHLGDPALKSAVDGLSYRARRILLPFAASLAAWGNPGRAMRIFAAENVICWYVLAVLLFRWFPPTSWENCFRWAAVLFSFGLIFSVTRALLDGPSLLLLAAGMALAESGRPRLACGLLAVSGLAKDTTVLGSFGLGPGQPGARASRARFLLTLGVAALPLVLWALWLRLWLGRSDDVGARNFAAPFAGFVHKVGASVALLCAGPRESQTACLDLLVMAGLTAQFLFFALRWRWREPWWRVGASYAVLMTFLGDAVWENYPTAASRVLLPMALAFNILTPRKGWWAVLLVAGNLGMIASIDISKPPGRESYVVRGPSELSISPNAGAAVEAVFGPGDWWPPERSRFEFFRWNTAQEGRVTVLNRQAFPLVSNITFGLRSDDGRGVTVAMGGRVLWHGTLEALRTQRVELQGILLAPGATAILLVSDRPAAFPGGGDARRLSFSVRDLKIELVGRR
jgi:hypothetical protein